MSWTSPFSWLRRLFGRRSRSRAVGIRRAPEQPMRTAAREEEQARRSWTPQPSLEPPPRPTRPLALHPRALRERLSDPGVFREVFVLKVILDPPVAMRRREVPGRARRR